MLTSIFQTNTAICCLQIFVRTILLPAANQYLSDQYCYLVQTSIFQTNTAICYLPVFVRPILLPGANTVYVRTIQLSATYQYLSDQYSYLVLTSVCQNITAICCLPIFVREFLLLAANQYLSDQYCYLEFTSICQTNTATWY